MSVFDSMRKKLDAFERDEALFKIEFSWVELETLRRVRLGLPLDSELFQATSRLYELGLIIRGPSSIILTDRGKRLGV